MEQREAWLFLEWEERGGQIKPIVTENGTQLIYIYIYHLGTKPESVQLEEDRGAVFFASPPNHSNLLVR